MADFNSEGGYVFTELAGAVGPEDKFSVKHDTQRQTRIINNWNFYLDEHWTFKREDGEPLITINYLRALIDKKIAFLIGSDFTLNVPPVLQPITLPILQRVWEDNGRQAMNYEICQEGAVSGDVFLLVTMEAPSYEQSRFDPLSKYRIVIQLLHSHECYPEWDDDSPRNKYGRKMESFTVVQKRRVKKSGSDQYEDVNYTMKITDNAIYTQLGKGPIRTRPNVLGEIPVVHIKNKVSNLTDFGIDDCSDLIPLNREVNEKSTDVSDTINYNANPITVVTGARAGSLERSPRAIWSGLPQGSTVEYLKLEGELTASVSYIERIKSAMYELAGVPQGSLGNEDRKVTGTSGETWHAQLQPLLDERNKKRSTYEPGFERVNYFILRYAEHIGEVRLPEGLCEKCGGKIAIFYEDDPNDLELPEGERRQIQVRKCYMANLDTFDFLNPDDVKVPILRQHSTGVEMTEVPLAQAEDEHGKTQTSYYDMAPVMPQGPDEPPQLPPGFKLPPEPETFDLEEVVVEYEDISDDSGQSLKLTVQRERTGVMAIPMECDQHSFLNPFTNYVTFNDTLPKDKKAQADLIAQYLTMKVVSIQWAMGEIGVENVSEMLQQIQNEQAIQAAVETQQELAAMPPEEEPPTE